jgi:hypothetical protein
MIMEGRVSAKARQGLLCQPRADDDYSTGFLGDHAAKTRPCAIVKSAEFMLDRLMQTLPGKLVELTDFKRKISIVDEDINGAKFFLSRRGHALDLIVLRHVRLKDHASAAVLLDFPEHLLRRFLVLVIVNHHCGA